MFAWMSQPSRRVNNAAWAICVALLCGLIYVIWPMPTIWLLRSRYAKAERGMTFQQTQVLMDYPSQTTHEWLTLWDYQQLSPAESDRIKSAIHYAVDTWYIDVYFEFTFDAEQRLVGKHSFQ